MMPLPVRLLFVLFFLLLTVIDVRQQRVPNALVYPAIVVVIGLHWLLHGLTTTAVLLGGGLAFVIFYLTARLRPGDLGGGDVKLATLIGLLFGFPHVLNALLVGALAGGATAVWLLLTRRGGRKTHIPYAPFLCLGAIIALFVSPIPFPIS